MSKLIVAGRTVCKGGELVLEMPVAPRAMFADGKVYRQAWLEVVPEEKPGLELDYKNGIGFTLEDDDESQVCTQCGHHLVVCPCQDCNYNSSKGLSDSCRCVVQLPLSE